jgi:glycosyltransferase involved in cell wall biosynthesis
MPKFNVVALGARDYYQVAIALHQRGLLGRLITDFYGSRFFKRFTAKRGTTELPDSKVLSSWPHALGLYLLRGARFNRARRHLVDYSFGFFAAIVTYFGPNQAIVYSYYLEGFCAFYRLIGSRPKRLICFQVHPTPWFINSIMDEDARRFRNYADVSFGADIEATFDKRDYYRYRQATGMCHGLIAASQVTVRSVFEGNTASMPVCVAPYGSKLSARAVAVDPPQPAREPIRILSICQLIQRKGLHWAFEAMKSLSPDDQANFVWTVVANSADPQVLALLPSNASVVRNLSDQELADHMQRADVFLLPSLIEGFGLVYVESLSQGTPIVYTENTGAYDICTDGVHGFCVPVSNLDSLAALLRQQLSDRPLLASLRRNCIELSAHITWSNFRSLVAEFAAGSSAISTTASG